MKQPLEVIEFDKIACSPKEGVEKSGYKYIPEKEFRALEEFIHTFNGDDTYSDSLDFFKIDYQRDAGNVISVNNYVGLIQIYTGYQIQILPKIEFGDRPNETPKVFIKMLRSMKDFPCKVFNDANVNVSKMSLYDIFINMYLQEARALVKRGLKSGYVGKDDNLRYYKGKLNVNEHIKLNFAHHEKFFVHYDEFLSDRAENRIIKATLLKLQRITTSFENQKEIRQLLIPFEFVEPSTNHQKEFSKVVIDRNTKDYEMLMNWSKVFLFDRGFTSFSGSTKARALLFPMEKLFEAYVAQQLKKVLPQEWDLSAQDRGYYLFDEPSKFALRPDIVIKSNGTVKFILDTKWKRLVNKPGKNYGISQLDMYQMYAYSKKYGVADIWLLYPLNNEMNNSSNISFSSNDGVKVHVFFVDVANIESSMQMLINNLKVIYE